jgi:hypothetical protein
MACRGCARRRQALIEQFNNGLRMSTDITQRIARKLNIGGKHDNIRMTREGVIKECSQCQKRTEPAPTAGQIPATTCDKCAR